MSKNLSCFRCKSPLGRVEEALPYGDNKELHCKDCLQALLEKPSTCPNCNHEVTEHEEVGLVLTPRGSTPMEKAMAIDVLVRVCPACKILYFDQFNYSLLRGLLR